MLLSIGLRSENNTLRDPIIYLGREIPICERARVELCLFQIIRSGVKLRILLELHFVPPTRLRVFVKPSNFLFSHIDLIPTRAGSSTSPLGIRVVA